LIVFALAGDSTMTSDFPDWFDFFAKVHSFDENAAVSGLPEPLSTTMSENSTAAPL
jgi:hypothetical protein